MTIYPISELRKNLYTRMYIYAKPEAIMYKYTVVTPVFRGTNSGKFQRTRTIFGAFGAVLEYLEGRKSNHLLQNGGFQHLSRRYFRFYRGRFSGSPRWSFFLLAMVITILMTIASTKKAVFGFSQIDHFFHRCTLGERTDKI